MNRPIPRKMLPHTIVWEKLLGKNQFQQIDYGAVVTVRYVRFEPSSRVVQAAEGEFLQYKGLLIIDTRNSMPSDIVYNKGDRITFGNTAYSVQQVDRLYTDRDKLHHWELALV